MRFGYVAPSFSLKPEGKRPGELEAQLRAEGLAHSSYSSAMNKFYADLDERVAEREQKYGFLNKELGEKAREFDLGHAEDIRQFDLTESFRRDELGYRDEWHDAEIGLGWGQIKEEARQADMTEAFRQKELSFRDEWEDARIAVDRSRIAEEARQANLNEAFRQKELGFRDEWEDARIGVQQGQLAEDRRRTNLDEQFRQRELSLRDEWKAEDLDFSRDELASRTSYQNRMLDIEAQKLEAEKQGWSDLPEDFARAVIGKTGGVLGETIGSGIGDWLGDVAGDVWDWMGFKKGAPEGADVPGGGGTGAIETGTGLEAIRSIGPAVGVPAANAGEATTAALMDYFVGSGTLGEAAAMAGVMPAIGVPSAYAGDAATAALMDYYVGSATGEAALATGGTGATGGGLTGGATIAGSSALATAAMAAPPTMIAAGIIGDLTGLWKRGSEYQHVPGEQDLKSAIESIGLPASMPAGNKTFAEQQTLNALEKYFQEYGNPAYGYEHAYKPHNKEGQTYGTDYFDYFARNTPELQEMYEKTGDYYTRYTKAHQGLGYKDPADYSNYGIRKLTGIEDYMKTGTGLDILDITSTREGQDLLAAMARREKGKEQSDIAYWGSMG